MNTEHPILCSYCGGVIRGRQFIFVTRETRLQLHTACVQTLALDLQQIADEFYSRKFGKKEQAEK